MEIRDHSTLMMAEASWWRVVEIRNGSGLGAALVCHFSPIGVYMRDTQSLKGA
jgi:hypothetical protein